MQDDINKLKKIIYNKLTTLQNYSIIHEFVEKNSIPKTVNQNGTFINLSLLSDAIIIELYEIFTSGCEHKKYLVLITCTQIFIIKPEHN